MTQLQSTTQQIRQKSGLNLACISHSVLQLINFTFLKILKVILSSISLGVKNNHVIMFH